MSAGFSQLFGDELYDYAVSSASDEVVVAFQGLIRTVEESWLMVDAADALAPLNLEYKIEEDE